MMPGAAICRVRTARPGPGHRLCTRLALALILTLGGLPASASVLCVQEVLALHGYDPGPLDGIVGTRTRDTARSFASDYGLVLPGLTAASAPDWCAALRRISRGAGGEELDPAAVETGATEGQGEACTLSPPDGYAREITSLVDGDPLTLRVAARFGGAVESVRWRGKEFINIYDHGRQISYAWHLDGWGECLNPTEPGAAADNFRQSSTTELLRVCSSAPKQLSTRARPAFWLAPGESGFCDRGARTAVNETLVSDNLFGKTIEIGYRGLDNVIVFDAAITLERDYASLRTEMPTGYLTHEFTSRHVLDLVTGALVSPAPDTPVEPWSFNAASRRPPILATEDGAFAMGAYTAEPVETYEILFYDVPNPSDRTNKWNMVIGETPAPAGTYRYRSFVIVGTLAEVHETMLALTRLHPIDPAPPEGYVDRADCTEIAGWAWDPKAPDIPVTIEIFASTGDTRDLVFSGPADHFRPDLPPVLGDNGVHGYHFPTAEVLDSPGPHLLQVEAVNSVEGLPNVRLVPGEVRLHCPP